MNLTACRIAGLALVVSLSASAGFAATYCVATNGNDSDNTGTDWDSPLLTISNALAKADVETILVSNGTYALEREIAVTKAVTIRGVNGPETVIVDAAQNGRCMAVSAAARLANLTLANGRLTNNALGGGLYLNHAGAWVTHCIIRDNLVTNSGAARADGGGVYITAAGGTLSNCTIIGNRTAHNVADGKNDGGGVCLLNGQVIDCLIVSNAIQNWNSGGWAKGGGLCVNGHAVARGCMISNNWSSNIGGGSSGSLIDCVVADNIAANNCGGASLAAGQILVGCTIINNAGGANSYGGGVYVSTEAIGLSNCVVKGNRAYYYAGIGAAGVTGIWNTLICQNVSTGDWNYGSGINIGGSVRLTRLVNCTITSNYPGHGLCINDAAYPFSVTNCIIAGNGKTGTSNIKFFGTTYTTGMFHYCCCPTTVLPADQGNITNSPAFADFAAGNYRLAKESPCINAGINQAWMAGATDLDGHPRIYAYRGTNVDMGAYEYYVPRGTLIQAQ